jgi:hypothetical protein
MKFSQFSEILSNLSLVSRVRFKTADGWTIFSVIRSFDGWILIDQTGNINFRFTRTAEAKDTTLETVDLFFSSDRKSESYIGSVTIRDVDGVEAI